MSDPVMGDEIGTGAVHSSMEKVLESGAMEKVNDSRVKVHESGAMEKVVHESGAMEKVNESGVKVHEPGATEKVNESGVSNGHGHYYSSSSSSSSSDDEHVNQRKFHLFGRQKPIHKAFGGGKPADVVLWRNRPMSGGLLAGATVIWLLFEWIGYHLITFLCHSLILCLATLFLWSNLSYSVNRSSPNFPQIVLPEDLCMSIALLLRDRCNQAFGIFRQVASGNDLKKFLSAILGLWVVSIVGSWFDFLTLVYIIFVILLTMPLLYEKHEDRVDSYAQKATIKLMRQYSKLDEKVLQKLPKVPFITDNKQH